MDGVKTLDGRTRAIVVAESLARVIAAIRVTSVRWQSYLLPKHRHGPHMRCVRCVAISIARSAFICTTFVPRVIASSLARVDRAR